MNCHYSRKCRKLLILLPLKVINVQKKNVIIFEVFYDCIFNSQKHLSIFSIDNIFAVKSWAKRKFGFEENKIDKNFGIPEDFDYID